MTNTTIIKNIISILDKFDKKCKNEPYYPDGYADGYDTGYFDGLYESLELIINSMSWEAYQALMKELHKDWGKYYDIEDDTCLVASMRKKVGR